MRLSYTRRAVLMALMIGGSCSAVGRADQQASFQARQQTRRQILQLVCSEPSAGCPARFLQSARVAEDLKSTSIVVWSLRDLSTAGAWEPNGEMERPGHREVPLSVRPSRSDGAMVARGFQATARHRVQKNDGHPVCSMC